MVFKSGNFPRKFVSFDVLNLRGANPPKKKLFSKSGGLTGVQPPHPKFRGG